MKNRKLILLLMVGLFISIFTQLFNGPYLLNVIAAGITFISVVLLFMYCKKITGIQSYWSFIKKEYDITILLIGVLILGSKSLAPVGYQPILSFLSIGIIFSVLIFGTRKRERASGR